MGEVYTYYYPNAEPVTAPGPLRGHGRAWVEGAYRPPTFPSALNVRVGDAGVKVVAVIRYLRAYGGDTERVLHSWSPLLTREDVEAAISFYERPGNRAEIDQQLAEDAVIA